MICSNEPGVAIAQAFALAAVCLISYRYALPSSRSEFGPSTTANSSNPLLEVQAESSASGLRPKE